MIINNVEGTQDSGQGKKESLVLARDFHSANFLACMQ